MRHPSTFRAAVLLVVAALLGASTTVYGQDQSGPHEDHILINVGEMSWAPADALPPGAEIAVIEGDPSQPGPFTMRGRLPANYEIPPHWHPAIEHVTVLSGTFNVASGDADRSEGTALGPGGFMAMPPESVHYAWTTEETVVQVHGIGPWDIRYVNPEDDPRARTP